MPDFILRSWQFQDLNSLVRYANNPKIADNLTDGFPYPYTREAGEKFIRMTQAKDPQTIFAIDIDGEAVGSIGLHPQSDIMRKNAELGYWLAEPLWGKGIITRAIARITDYGFQNLDIERIFARPFGSNTGSQKALEKAGFEFEYRFKKTIWKNGRFEDELYYAARRAAWSPV